METVMETVKDLRAAHIIETVIDVNEERFKNSI